MTSSDNNDTPSLKHQSNLSRLSESHIHDWYRFVYAFSDRIVVNLVDEFDISQDDLLLDPFNGTGTTTLTAKKLGIDAIGTDTSPASVLSSRVKTNWSVDLDEFRTRRATLLATLQPICKHIRLDGKTTLESFTDQDHQQCDLSAYDFSQPPKTPAGWLSQRPLKKATVLRHHIDKLPEDGVTDLFRLAMIAILPEDVGNVRFGPEATRDRSQEGDKPVFHIFQSKLRDIEQGLETVQQSHPSSGGSESEILRTDAREIASTLCSESRLLDTHNGSVDYVITSPPYPAEHDYTRNQRLELVWLGVCDDTEALRKIKKRNIRSHTKNIYVGDNEAEQLDIRSNERINAIVSEMEQIIDREEIQHGFGQAYPRVVEEYFAGMQNHLQQVFELLAPGGKAVYVVGDSGSYWQVKIETAEILAELASNRVGFENATIRLWRNMQATDAAYDEIEENILVLSKRATEHPDVS